MGLVLSDGRTWNVQQQQKLSALTATDAVVQEQLATPAMVLVFAISFVTTQL